MKRDDNKKTVRVTVEKIRPMVKDDLKSVNGGKCGPCQNSTWQH